MRRAMSDGRLGAERRAAAGSTLRNQVAVVTGAAGAIGRAVAGLFAAAGTHLAVSLETWREVFAVNVEAVLTASQQAAVRQASRVVLPVDDPEENPRKSLIAIYAF